MSSRFRIKLTLKCFECPEEFPNVVAYIGHGKKHHRRALYPCPLCPESGLYSGKSLKEHISKHERVFKYRCLVCEEGQPVVDYMAHQKFHIFERDQVFCSWCNSLRVYRSPGGFSKHLGSHHRGVAFPERATFQTELEQDDNIPDDLLDFALAEKIDVLDEIAQHEDLLFNDLYCGTVGAKTESRNDLLDQEHDLPCQPNIQIPIKDIEQEADIKRDLQIDGEAMECGDLVERNDGQLEDVVFDGLEIKAENLDDFSVHQSPLVIENLLRDDLKQELLVWANAESISQKAMDGLCDILRKIPQSK